MLCVCRNKNLEPTPYPFLFLSFSGWFSCLINRPGFSCLTSPHDECVGRPFVALLDLLPMLEALAMPGASSPCPFSLCWHLSHACLYTAHLCCVDVPDVREVIKLHNPKTRKNAATGSELVLVPQPLARSPPDDSMTISWLLPNHNLRPSTPATDTNSNC